MSEFDDYERHVQVFVSRARSRDRDAQRSRDEVAMRAIDERFDVSDRDDAEPAWGPPMIS